MIDIKDIKHSLKNMTSNPGVYRMIDSENKVIYVGKAKNLKNRVSSYFRTSNHSTRIKRMISLIKKVDITITKSEADAFLFENIQIKKYRPRPTRTLPASARRTRWRRTKKLRRTRKISTGWSPSWSN